MHHPSFCCLFLFLYLLPPFPLFCLLRFFFWLYYHNFPSFYFCFTFLSFIYLLILVFKLLCPPPCIFELILSLFPLLCRLSVDHFILTCLIQKKRNQSKKPSSSKRELNIIMPRNWNLNFISIEYHFLKRFFMFLFLQIALTHPTPRMK